MKSTKWLLAFLAGFLTVFACGCGGRTKVTGTVTLDGNPLSGAAVVFQPKEDATLGAASARTGPDGRFELQPRPGTNEALPPGKYMVLITRFVDTKGNVPSDEEFTKLSFEDKLINQLPKKYNEKSSPQFVVEIKSGDNELPPFDVKSK
jgi:hypothetical protein